MQKAECTPGAGVCASLNFPSQKVSPSQKALCIAGVLWVLWVQGDPAASGHSLPRLDSTSGFSRGVCAPTGDLLSLGQEKVSAVCPVLRDMCGAGWGIILLWVLSPLGLRTAFGCVLFPFKHTGSAARSQDGALGWGWVTAVLGLPSQNTVSNLPPRSLPGYAGG